MWCMVVVVVVFAHHTPAGQSGPLGSGAVRTTTSKHSPLLSQSQLPPQPESSQTKQTSQFVLQSQN